MKPLIFTDPAIGSSYYNDPRLAYSQQLLQQGSSTAPVRSWGEGLARALSAGVGGVLQSNINSGYRGRESSYQKSLADALSNPDQMQAILASNPDTAPEAFGMVKSSQALRQKTLADLYAKGLAPDASGQLAPVPGYGSATGANAAAATTAQIPADVAKQQAMIPGAVDQATQTAIQQAKVDLQKAAAMGPIATANEVAKIKATMPLAVQQAVLTAQATGPVNTANAVAQAQAMGPVNTANAVGQAQALGPVNAANAAMMPKLPDLTTVMGPDGTSVSVDKTTPEGQAKLRELIGKGYTERQSGGVTINNMNEDQAKATQLFLRSQQQLKIATDNWDELGKIGNQAASKVPLGGNFMVSDKYQQAAAAVKDIAASYLYSVSGATANPGEVANLVDTIVPKPGDSTTTVTEKKQRITDMVNSIQLRMKQGMTNQPSLPGTTVNNVVSPTGAPKPGDVDGGYRFKGGDPADSANWEKIP